MIRKPDSLVLAENILNRVINEAGNDINGDVEVFDNGREQGFKIISFEPGKWRSIAFAEHRNSDSITLWFRKDVMIGLENCSNRTFKPSEINEAVEFIIEFLKGEEV